MHRNINKMTIIVEPYQPKWATQYQTIYNRIWPRIQTLATSMEHVGSTSVVGLSAKPRLDIDIILTQWTNLPEIVNIMARFGYVHRGNLGILHREAFKAPPGSVDQNLYVCLAGSTALKNHITLRDHLRAHPEARESYGQLKQHLAAQFPDDIDAYIDGKTAFILDILAQYDLSQEALNEIEAVNVL